MDAKTIRELVNVMKGPDKATSSYDTMAEVTRVEDDIAWVHIPGGIEETPVAMTVNAKEGDTVRVRLSGGRAWLVGSDTAPPTDDTKANEADEKAETATTKAETAQRSADDAKKTATNYMASNEYGLMIADMRDGQETPETATGRNVLIDYESVNIRNGQDVVASFGEEVTLGKSNDAHANVNKSKLTIYGYGGTKIAAQIGSNNDDDSGLATVTETVTTSGFVRIDNVLYYGFTPVCQPAVEVVSCTVGETSVQTSINQAGTFIYSSAFTESTVATVTYKTSETVSFAAFNSATASGLRSFASGMYTTAQGTNSTAFGYGSKALAPESFAEGSSSSAESDSAHAEGSSTKATGLFSHAEGRGSVASGTASHAQNYYTIASTENQTAMGSYNEVDFFEQFLLIIGNGTSENARSNAYTFDKYGNMSFATNANEGIYAAIIALGWGNEVLT